MASGEACTVSLDGRDVLETVTRINGRLVAGGEDAEAVLESLQQLQAVPMTFEALETTKIGRAVNALRKSASSEQVRELTATLYWGWKALAFEHLRNSRRSRAPVLAPTDVSAAAKLCPNTPEAANKSVRSSLPVKPKPASSSLCSRSKEKQRSKQQGDAPSETEQRAVAARQSVGQHTAALPKTAPACKPTRSNKEASPAATTSPETPIRPSGSSAGKRKEAPTSMDEASLERAKRRLHERYQEATAVKEKRRIQVINAPGTFPTAQLFGVAKNGARRPRQHREVSSGDFL